jgi:hypothetical protein
MLTCSRWREFQRLLWLPAVKGRCRQLSSDEQRGYLANSIASFFADCCVPDGTPDANSNMRPAFPTMEEVLAKRERFARRTLKAGRTH